MTRPSHELLERLCRAPNPVYATDENNRIIAWNRSAEDLLGYRAVVAVGRECHALVGGTDVYGNDFCDRECSVLKMVRRNRMVRRFDIHVRHASGESIRAHCTILVVPGPTDSRFGIIHVLEPAAERATSGESRETTPVVGAPSRFPPSSGGRAPLTSREQEILRLLATGAGTREIADSLFISPTTVRTHIRNLLHKMHAHSRLEAVLKGLRSNAL